MSEVNSIMDNQALTADILNDIVIDLGVTSFSTFTGLNQFGADELNEITKALVTNGILYYGNQCAPSWNASEQTLTINTGVMVFNSGQKKKIKDSPVTISNISPGSYIYAHNNIANNTCEIIASYSLPTDTNADYLEIAYIDSNNRMTDRRSFAKTNMPYNNQTGRNYTYSREFTLDFPYRSNISIPSYTYSLPWSGYNVIYCEYKASSSSFAFNCSIAEENVEKALIVGKYDGSSGTQYDYVLKFLRNGNTITFTPLYDNYSTPQSIKKNFSFTLTFA